MGLTIDVTYDSYVTGLETSDPTLYTEYTSAIQTAVSYYETLIKNPITVDITFGYGELDNGADPVYGGGENTTGLSTASYATLRSDLLAAYDAGASTPALNAVQQAAAASLPATDPTGGSGSWFLTTALATALGVDPASTKATAYVALSQSTATDPSNGLNWSYTQSSVGPTQYDAVGTLEHEISEVLGRQADGGQSNINGSPDYEPLDLFRYTAADGLGTDAPGAAAGAREEPFVGASYNPDVDSYFSYNGTTVTLPYDTPAQVSNGADVADWTNSVVGDSYGVAYRGSVGAISQTDLDELAVLGYEINCFLPGTLIATPEGEARIEDLSVGDLVATFDGRHEAIRWVGRQTVVTAFADPLLARPIRIKAGALGPEIPRRDLLVSPGHGLLVADVLVQAGALVNGTGIVREADLPAALVYHHIELDEHALILAENAPAESFLASAEAIRFDNLREVDPQGPRAAEMSYPRVRSQRELPKSVREMLTARAAIVPEVSQAA